MFGVLSVLCVMVSCVFLVESGVVLCVSVWVGDGVGSMCDGKGSAHRSRTLDNCFGGVWWLRRKTALLWFVGMKSALLSLLLQLLQLTSLPLQLLLNTSAAAKSHVDW